MLEYIILFVNNPEESAKFYARLLDLKPVEESPTFVLFALPNGLNLGLWSRHTAQPQVTAPPGGSDIGFTEPDVASVEKLHAKWRDMGVTIALAPMAMDGLSSAFLALDPDGHRIRVVAL